MEGEGGVTRIIIGEIQSLDTQRYQMKGERGVNQSIIDELYSSNGRKKWCYSKCY